MALLLYRLLQFILAPLIFLLMAWRLARGQEEKATFDERLGHARQPRPSGPLLWVHGASVGESLSTLPVLRAIRRQQPALPLLLTSGTRTGRTTLATMAASLPDTAPIIIQSSPVDVTAAVRRFYRHWQPTVSVFIESDFWPELLSQAPHPVLLNGRISDRSWPRYRRHRWFFYPLIKRFKLALAQRDEDAKRLKALGAKHVQVAGNLKFDADPLPVDDAQLAKFQTLLAGRPVLVAASTHPGEEDQLAQLHLALKPQIPDLLTIIIPRHPHRGTQASNEIARHTRAVRRRGLGETPTLGGARHTDIYMADTLGELGLWYRLATVALVGGSLVKHGGQNPLEPLKLGVPTVSGPHMFNFKDMLPLLTERGLLTIAPDLTTLTREVQKLLTNGEALATARAHIAEVMPTLSGSSVYSATTILEQLDQANYNTLTLKG